MVQIGNARLDGIIKALEAQFRFGGALVQLGDMLAAALGMFFPPVERGGKDSFQPLGLEKLLLKVSKLMVTLETSATPQVPSGTVLFTGNCAKLW